MLKEWVDLFVEKLLSVGNQMRDIIRIILIQFEGQFNEFS